MNRGVFMTFTDGITGGDMKILGGGKTLTDVGSLSEQLSRVFTGTREYTETFSMGELLAKLTSTTKADTLTIVEELTPILVYVRALEDVVSLTEAMNRAVTASRTENFALSDAVNRMTSRTRGDTLSFTDTADAILVYVRTLSDIVNLTGLINRDIAAIKSDGVTFSDAVNKAISMNREDTISMLDDAIKRISLVSALAETLNLTESITRGVQVTVVDTVELDDILQKIKAIHRTLSDGLTLSDEASSTFLYKIPYAVTIALLKFYEVEAALKKNYQTTTELKKD
jgi:hypothetical protein